MTLLPQRQPQILVTLLAAPTPLPAGQIAARCGLPRATVQHALLALVAKGFVAQEHPRGPYQARRLLDGAPLVCKEAL